MTTALPPLRLPRALIDPRVPSLPPADDQGLVAVELEHAEGRFTAIRGHGGPPRGLPLALTPLVEPHAHLDKAFTADAFPNPAGTLEAALAANLREADLRRVEDVLERGERALQRAWRHGLRAVRTHIDSLGPGSEPSWEALQTLQKRWAARVHLQLVALVPIAHWRTAAGEDLASRVARAGGLLGGVLGGPLPLRPTDGEAVLALLRLAERLGCGVDLHIDESDGRPGAGAELVTDLLLEHRIALPLVFSHASSMGLMGDRACRRLADRMAAAGVGVVALPSTNLWLLGGRPGRTPWLRPQAPIRQLQAAGVEVALGGDNVQDPWFPGGDFDPVELLRFALVVSHVQPWLRQGITAYAGAAARLLGLEWDGVVRAGSPADLLVLGVDGWRDLLARAPQRRVLRGGQWLEPPPGEAPSPLLASLAA